MATKINKIWFPQEKRISDDDYNFYDINSHIVYRVTNGKASFITYMTDYQWEKMVRRAIKAGAKVE